MKIKKFLIGIITGVGLLLVSIVPVFASTTVVYNNIPNPLPANVVSEAFEATSTSEFGGQMQFAGTNRYNPTIAVVMSSWACTSGNWSLSNCITTPANATFTFPVTLNVYNVNADNSPGSLITTMTKTFTMPYRPSADMNGVGGCDKTQWYDPATKTCNHGKAFTINFDLNGVTLPDKAIVSVAYNTSDYGSSPLGDNTVCHSTSEGCPYDSLNVGLNSAPTIGTALPTANDAYINSKWSGAYCSTSEPTGTFHLDPGCWTGYLPAFEVSTQPVPVPPPTTFAECQSNGWKIYNNPAFSSEADCILYVTKHMHTITGNVTYNAYGLNRNAIFVMNSALANGTFAYHDANNGSYLVTISDVNVNGNTAWFAGIVSHASDLSWNGQWLFGKIVDSHPDLIWGSFTNQSTAENGVTNMTSPADGPFTVTGGNLAIN